MLRSTLSPSSLGRLRRVSTCTLTLLSALVLALLIVALRPEGAIAGATKVPSPPTPTQVLRPAVNTRPVSRVAAHPHRPPRARPFVEAARRHADEPHRAAGRSEPPTVTIRVATVATGSEGQAAVNRCQGPVEVLWSAYGYANDIIQHDYCGGAWMAGIRPGLRIRIIGGTQPGLYIANGQRRVAPKHSTIAVMAGIGDLALQTCEGPSLVYVGLSRL